MFGAHGKGRLDEREIRVVRHDGFGKHGELHALLTQLENFLDDFVDGAFTAVEHGADLYGGGFDKGHGGDLIEGMGFNETNITKIIL
ncbi:hypothetical protein D3C76_802590 [compost metagenome]